jgi:hypothetical protein
MSLRSVGGRLLFALFLSCTGSPPVLRDGGADGASGPGPKLTAVAPDRGPPAGGTFVVLRGLGFSAGATASIGGKPLAEVTVVNGETLTGSDGLFDCSENRKLLPFRYDSDALPDLLILRFNTDWDLRQHRLLHNDGGTFTEITNAAWRPIPWHNDATYDGVIGQVDNDADGLLDLVTVGIYSGPRVYLNKK